MKIRVDEDQFGQLDLILNDDDVPKTVQNFVHFLEQSNNNKTPAGKRRVFEFYIS